MKNQRSEDIKPTEKFVVNPRRGGKIMSADVFDIATDPDVRFAAIKKRTPQKPFVRKEKTLGLSKTTMLTRGFQNLQHKSKKQQPSEAQHVLQKAQAVFGNRKASLWLERPNSALDGKKPCDMLSTNNGHRLVENLLDRIAHGLGA